MKFVKTVKLISITAIILLATMACNSKPHNANNNGHDSYANSHETSRDSPGNSHEASNENHGNNCGDHGECSNNSH